MTAQRSPSKKPRRGVPKNLAFKDERLLQEALIGLLQRMPNVSDVQLLHGSREVGKDIVFKFAGPFGQQIQCGCIVKNTPLDGSAIGRSSAQAVLTQTRQTLANEYTDGSGERRQIQRVYVVSSSPISRHAMASVAGEIRERKGQVQFISGEELVRLFLVHWPDFLADEAAAINAYAKELRASLVEQTELSHVIRMYPRVGFAENRGFTYIWTGVRFRAREEQIQSYLPTVKSSEFGPAAITLYDLERVKRRIVERKAFLEHVTLYYPRAESKEILNRIEHFVNALHETWLDGTPATERASAGDPGTSEYRVIQRFDPMAMELRDLNEAAAEIARPLVEALESIVQISLETPHGSLLLHDQRVLRYLHAVDCLRSYEQSGDFADESRSIFQIPLSQDDFLSAPGLKLAVAPVGYGKTSLCRWCALQDVERLRAGTATDVPFYVRLSSADPNALRSASQLLRAGTHSVLLNERDWRAVKRGTANVRLYLDGLDEIATEEQRREVVTAARLLAKRHKRWAILLTSRDYIHGEWLEGIPRLELIGFSDEDVDTLAEKLLKGATHTAATFRQQLDSMAELKSLSRVPLLATLMILIFRGIGQLPASRAAMYVTFVDLLCGGWNLAKGIQRSIAFGREVKVAVLARLAMSAHESGQMVFDLDQFHFACLAAAPGIFAARRAVERTQFENTLLQELVQDGLLSRSANVLQFTHFSFQEFMTARGLASGASGAALENAHIAYINGADWWREVLSFTIGLSPDPSAMADWLSSVYNKLERKTVLTDKRQQVLLDALSNAFPDFQPSWR